MRWKSICQSDNSLEDCAYHVRGVSRRAVHFGRVPFVRLLLNNSLVKHYRTSKIVRSMKTAYKMTQQ